MAYIRDRHTEKTGYQTGSPFTDSVDFGNDFVMVYRTDETMPERVRQFREKGYVIHLMTGIAWGGYTDYLYGRYDGRDHWDEAQLDRYGNRIMHGEDTPYMVPTIAFADYLTEKLKRAVDAGVEAIHVEEPEFWDRGGYSEAFKREYRLYYRADWTPPHESVDAMYKCASLKAYLYKRTIDRVSSALKEYAAVKYGRQLRFYVPTHSLLNYTQWKIVSPEGKLADIPAVDGCIAQVWTGTSRERNWYRGVFAERNFETSYLEFGVMQELVRGTGRRMWFLHDPVEDIPDYGWDDYSRNYIKTVSASLLHTGVNDYEICPWPNRFIDGKYPRDPASGTPIPEDYRTVLANLFQALGDMENAPDASGVKVGIFMSDTELYERNYPDSLTGDAVETVGTVIRESEEEYDEYRSALFTAETPPERLMLRFKKTSAFPSFYGMALPLLKRGVPVRPVLLDNLKRYPGYLDEFDALVLSYEFMKPETPDVNNAIAARVRDGAVLIYAGDGSDPYHGIDAWWSGKYHDPAQHLFEMLGLAPDCPEGIFPVGKGAVCVIRRDPASYSFSAEGAEAFASKFREALAFKGLAAPEKNHLTARRGHYLIAAVMNESVSDEPLTLTGRFADMYAPDLDVKTRVVIEPDCSALLFDLDLLPETGTQIVGTSVRVLDLREEADRIVLTVTGAKPLNARIRLRPAFPVETAVFTGSDDPIALTRDEIAGTVLLRFAGETGEREIVLR